MMKPFLLCLRLVAAAGLLVGAGVSVAQEAAPPETPPQAGGPIKDDQNKNNQNKGDQDKGDGSSNYRDGASRAERPEWEIKFEDALRTPEYARQLDYFGIELGAIGKDGEIQYASQLSKKPIRRVGASADENRTYITWKVGTLSKFDANLLAKAGVTTKDKTIAHFYPVNVTRDLMALERAFADREQREILRTRFGVRVKPDNDHEYEFFVEEQDPRLVSSGQ